MNDCLHSLSAALISALPRFLVTSLDTTVYSLVYRAIYQTTTPDNPSSFRQWIMIFLAADFGYYWFHRAAHEINILWAAHQVHHSSEDINIAVSVRQSVVQQFFTWIFYLPLALIGIAPSILKTHLWFSCLYQIWTHTEVVGNLGPLEYVFVTPVHHRVHHGRNPYCIDKNYGGILIIWDRLFGTFVEEQGNEPPVYGLVVERVNHWNPIWTQISHYCYLVRTFWTIPGISNKFFVLFNGPSWSPGQSRLGDETKYEEIEYPVTKYDKTLPRLTKFYVLGHFLLVLFVYYKHLEISQSCSVYQTIAVVTYLLFALTTFGALFDHKWYGPTLEAVRCIVYIILDSSKKTYYLQQNHGSPKVKYEPTSGFMHSIFIISFAMWFFVETMKINWTGTDGTPEENKKYSRDERFGNLDANKNILSNADIIYLQCSK
ncbi:alkylglycerol monooxygenase-like isoform X2 [Dendronephthya gigantea]|nr:alkylglycerol monooxygenase-like isoform X2 [Dendronephthya gigantea]